MVLVLFICVPAISALPNADDITKKTDSARKTINEFQQESFELRLKYDFYGQFPKIQDAESLNKLAKNANYKLINILTEQLTIKQQIEQYQGTDWDKRYGSTGLWRKLTSDIYLVSLSRLEILFFLALSSGQPQKNELLQTMLNEINSLEQQQKPIPSLLLRAKALALLSQQDNTLRKSALEKFDLLRQQTEDKPAFAIRIAVERIKLLGPVEPDELTNLAKEIEKTSDANSIEPALSLTLLMRRYNNKNFEKTVNRFPRTKEIIGSLLLKDLTDNMQNLSIFEAELAALSAWKTNPENYRQTLQQLSSIEKFQTPPVLYVTAAALADSSVPEAIRLLLKAANSQHRRKNSNLYLQAHEIAAKAAQLAYELFTRDKSICKLALDTFGKYQKLAGKDIDEELEYYYTIVLQNCGRQEKAEELLKKIATRTSSNLRNVARLDLIKLFIKNNPDQQQHTKLLEQLPELIADCSASNQIDLRIDALELYCSILLEENKSNSWQKALEALTNADTTIDPNLNALISRAHQQLGDLEKAVETMLPAIESNNPEHVEAVMLLLSQVIEQIDQLRDSGNDFHDLVDNSLNLAKYCQTISQNTNEHLHSIHAHLLLAEFSIFAAERDRAKILEIENLLEEASTASGQQNAELTRCRARLAVAKKDFDQAAKLWAKLAQIRRTDTALSQGRSYKWWRAKFYELKCRSKQPNISKARIVHTIDVLENTIRDIPDIWAKKLTLLRRQCQAKEPIPAINLP